MKICNKCNLEKDLTEFYQYKNAKIHGSCKSCIQLYNRERYKNPEISEKRKKRGKLYNLNNKEKVTKKSKQFYKSNHGRALTLLKSAQRRASKYKEEIDIDYEFILEKLNLGVCEVTGIYFDFESHDTYAKNPFAPSIDRINSSVGYTKDNTRVVIWQYNLMKGEIDDSLLLEICKLLVKNNDK